MPRTTKPRAGRLVLTAKQATALRNLIDYTIDAEQDHYYEYEPDERGDHAYAFARTLALATGQMTVAEIVKLDAEDAEARA